ncbi:hypothetical protein KFS98_003573 [Salmonella enterica]|nr:hypothetical protein [Salmonella enterica]
MAYESKATLTTKGRIYRAQELITGQAAIKIVGFCVGTEGYDPNDTSTALTPDPTAESLENEIFRDPYDAVEMLNLFTPVFVCTLEETEAVGPIGEIGLLAEVVLGPDAGQTYLHAVMHTPQFNKTSDETKTYRFVMPG